jgi:hypothetical protein
MNPNIDEASGTLSGIPSSGQFSVVPRCNPPVALIKLSSENLELL